MQTASPTAVLSSGPLTVFTLAAVRRAKALLTLITVPEPRGSWMAWKPQEREQND